MASPKHVPMVNPANGLVWDCPVPHVEHLLSQGWRRAGDEGDKPAEADMESDAASAKKYKKSGD